MRLFLSSIIALALLNSCGERNAKSVSAPTDSLVNSVSPPPDTLCFRQIVGRDSTTLRLYVNGTNVTGDLNVLPFEKDRARGAIRGKLLTSNRIEADWQRSGEGVTQPYEVIFTLKGDGITWREGERIEKQGKWVLKNPEQSYEYVLMKIDCR
ncbi:hypothetical protein IC229_03595 [Spirosoma sp. BT702]|uniref:Lipoprotein n=1 Tax=Spirosoma profusum TaxID=2771354 RepID=A0A926XXF7_9BACT|nr:hypothetical protein [Spirosoma profusum]MBD2699707.1 hypothetical protein [Spirosoma profusum]